MNGCPNRGVDESFSSSSPNETTPWTHRKHWFRRCGKRRKGRDDITQTMEPTMNQSRGSQDVRVTQSSQSTVPKKTTLWDIVNSISVTDEVLLEEEEEKNRFQESHSNGSNVSINQRKNILMKNQNFLEIALQDGRNETLQFQREMIPKFLASPCIKWSRFFMLILYMVTMAVHTFEPERQYGKALMMCETSVGYFLLLEMLLKWYSSFLLFWKTGWNIMDFAVIVIIFVPAQFVNVDAFANWIVRVFRILHFFRCLYQFNGFRTVIKSILNSLTDILHLLGLEMIIILIFTQIAICIFGSDTEYFSGIGTSLHSVFTFITQDGWNEIVVDFRKNQDSTMVISLFGAYMFFILMFSKLMLMMTSAKLCVGVRNAFDESKMKKLREEDNNQARDHDETSRGGQTRPGPKTVAEQNKLLDEMEMRMKRNEEIIKNLTL
uniref:Ion transport domain-containing protein n=1 Tax=Eptatretus burgeri TaxID=7764 RepID=A0A8C4NMP0_EPTBU